MEPTLKYYFVVTSPNLASIWPFLYSHHQPWDDFEKPCGNMLYHLSCPNSGFQYNPFDMKNEQGPLDWIDGGPKTLMCLIWIGFHITLSWDLSMSISHENCSSIVNIFKRLVYQGSTKLIAFYQFNRLCKSHFNIKNVNSASLRPMSNLLSLVLFMVRLITTVVPNYDSKRSKLTANSFPN